LAEGKRSKEVAFALNISVKTAETASRQYHAQIGMHSVSELVRYAVRNQMIEA
jgi:DNA-binding NarL/FixJ family response regulator